MNKREKIIIGIMLLAVVLGGFNFLGRPSENKQVEQDQQIGELNEFIVDVAGKINNKDNSKSEYILRKAGTVWERDPFLKSEFYKESLHKKENKNTGAAISLKYTGYLQIENKLLAIINGLEYEIQDIIDPGGYTVQTITPGKVVLHKKGKGRIILLIEE